MSPPPYFISCDWGTTNFRLRLVETDTLRVHADYRTDRGCKVHNETFLRQDRQNRREFYTAYLREAIERLPAPHRRHPLVLSGMASSSIGLSELPYTALPLAQTGANLHGECLSTTSGPDLFLISGVRSKNSMMRGEETQAIGLSPQLEPYGRGLLLLPGTHSKHLTYRDGYFTELRSYLTGELFDLLSRHSILAQSVTAAAWHPDREAAFRNGLSRGLAGTLSSGLFSVRADHVLRGTAPEDNTYLLSGLLIGHELSTLPTADPVFLAAADPLFSLYRTALATLLPPDRLVCFDASALERALLVGHRKILELHAAR